MQIAERMLAGENVSALAAEFDLPRSMMYRWRDAYRLQGPAALQGTRGRPRGPGKAPPGKRAGSVKAGMSKEASITEALRDKIAELERKVGQQAVEIDFFKGVFRRLEKLPKAKNRGGDASTRRS